MNNDQEFMAAAYEEAKKGYLEGGVPVGAVMVEDGNIIAAGHNKRVQQNDPLAHGEIDCIRSAGRRPRYDNVTLYTTLSPCMMCSGTIIQFGIKRVVIGENKNFEGNIQFLKDHGIEVLLMNDQNCIDLMSRFIKERPELWDEDIAGRE
ncbi:MAG: nucleoside deaminase [Candidatus Margulisiibacteriota bacterium]